MIFRILTVAVFLILPGMLPGADSGSRILYGTERGVYIYEKGRLSPAAIALKGIAVRRLYRYGSTLVALTRQSGPHFSADGGRSWEKRAAGLPVSGASVRPFTAFTMPENGIAVAATPHRLWISTNRGGRWRRLPRPRHTTYNTFHGLSARKDGGALHILAATAFNGLQHGVLGPGSPPRWKSGSTGLFGWLMEPRAFTYETVRGAVRLRGRYYAASGFGHGFYHSGNGRYWRRHPAPDIPGQALGLLRTPDGVQLLLEGGTALLKDGRWRRQTDGMFLAFGPRGAGINCLLALSVGRGRTNAVPRFFSEPVEPNGRLWWRPDAAALARRKLASGKRGVYFYTWLGRPFSRFRRFVDSLKGTRINAVVIDMKDDYGNVVYDSKLDIVKKVGSKRVLIDIKKALKLLKSRGLYSIARLVVFKDGKLWRYEKGKFAIKDRRTGRPWVGGHSQKEYWVDAHSSIVHRYNTDIAAELAVLGFDEIQFDYIRFPTDGPVHLCKYDFAREHLTKSEALAAFLRSARKRISVPISVDIYGFNGWYRMGDKQGQDIRLIRKYVDVVCPMYYPSHFGRAFMGQNVFRILKEGTARNVWLAGGRVIVRPYLQAFPYLARPWGTKYILDQVRGVEKGGGDGYLYWNMAGDYRVTLRAEKTEKK